MVFFMVLSHIFGKGSVNGGMSMRTIQRWMKNMGFYRLILIAIAISALIYIFTNEWEDENRSLWAMPLSG
jgi:hypothetical protein